MKLQTAKAGLWLVALALSGTLSGTTAAAAQISLRNSSQPNVPSVVSVGKPSEIESTLPAVNLESPLPDAPSAVAHRPGQETPAPAARPPLSPIDPSAGRTFWIANGALLGSTIANAAEIGNCRPSACQAVPSAIRNRGTLYAIGIPASLGISYISYRLKRGGTRWWIAPVALFTAGNIIYAVHASQFSNH
jgi:hypothetical protein